MVFKIDVGLHPLFYASEIDGVEYNDVVCLTEVQTIPSDVSIGCFKSRIVFVLRRVGSAE